jgi:acyl carrier protein
MEARDIERFIIDDLLQDSARQSVDLDEPLVSTGLIDSLAMLRLIGFLEEELNLKIGDGEVTLDNFETLRQLLQFLERKRAGAASS